MHAFLLTFVIILMLTFMLIFVLIIVCADDADWTFSLAFACETAWKFITLVIPIPQNMAKASTKYSSLLKKGKS